MNKNYYLIGILGFATIFCFVAWGVHDKSEKEDFGGAYSTEHPFFIATTTSATSTNTSMGNSLNIANADKVTMYFQRGDTTGTGNTGTSTFSVQVSQDNSNWITLNMLIDNVTNSNSQTLTRVGSSILSASANYGTATATKAYSLDLTSGVYKYLRCIVVEGTDGEHTCKALIQYR